MCDRIVNRHVFYVALVEQYSRNTDHTTILVLKRLSANFYENY